MVEIRGVSVLMEEMGRKSILDKGEGSIKRHQMLGWGYKENKQVKTTPEQHSSVNPAEPGRSVRMDGSADCLTGDVIV